MNGSTPAGPITIRAFDGTRTLFNAGKPLLVTIFNENQSIRYQNTFPGPEIQLSLAFHDGPGDSYAVTLWADGYRAAGFFPVKPIPGVNQFVDIMLIRDGAEFRFDVDWADLKTKYGPIANLLTQPSTDSDAEARYESLRDGDQQGALASFFNLTTAMSQIPLAQGTVMDYMRQVIWDGGNDETFAQDRFFGYSNIELIGALKQAEQQGQFAPEPDPGVFHGTATLSFKQVQFGECNVQLTFHENDKTPNPAWVKIEPDIDYYRDLVAHGLLEVLPNTVTHGLTDPMTVYVLRWIAGRRVAGLQEFAPPYTVV